MTSTEFLKQLLGAREAAYVAAREAIVKAVPMLRGKVVPREDVEAFVIEARLARIEELLIGMVAQATPGSGSVDEKTFATIIEYWGAVTKAIKGPES